MQNQRTSWRWGQSSANLSLRAISLFRGKIQGTSPNSLPGPSRAGIFCASNHAVMAKFPTQKNRELSRGIRELRTHIRTTACRHHPLSDVKPTSKNTAPTSANDPKRTNGLGQNRKLKGWDIFVIIQRVSLVGVAPWPSLLPSLPSAMAVMASVRLCLMPRTAASLRLARSHRRSRVAPFAVHQLPNHGGEDKLHRERHLTARANDGVRS